MKKRYTRSTQEPKMCYHKTMETTIIKRYKLLKSLAFQRTSSDIMTPFDVALRLVDEIPDRLFSSEVLIPGSGYGVFALALIHRGWDPHKITCVEIDKAFALLSQKYVGGLGAHIVNTDFLTWQPKMQFDVIIGNPPYQMGKNSNFYVKFIERSAELLKEGGYFSFIIPNRFTLPHTPAAKALKDNFQLGALKASINDQFPGIGTSIGHVTGVRRTDGHVGTTTLTLKDGTSIEYDPSKLVVPSKQPDAAGVKAWGEISKLDSYEVTRKRPETGEYVFIRRQWRSKAGAIFLDAVVGDHPEGHVDGAYIVTDCPKSVAEHLRGPVGPAIHKLFGDQMNLWPPLWQHLPTRKAWGNRGV